MSNNNRPISEQGRAPVYIPFKTFLTAIETLEPGLPPTLDRSVWPTFSGGLQSQTLGAFKFLGLIKEDGTVEPILEQLVTSRGSERKAVLREIIRDKYTGAISLARSSASAQQLQDYFRSSHEIKSGTLYRIIRFFLDACTYTGEKCSTHWAKAKLTPKRKSRKGGGETRDESPPKPPTNAMTPKASTKTIQLRSGGAASLTLNVDMIELTSGDWNWLREVIEKFNKYGKEQEQQEDILE